MVKQNFNVELKEIVPEYHSKISLVRKLFNKRIDVAIELYKNNVISKKLLDIGCGEGIFIERFDKDIEMIGIDKNIHIEELNNSIKKAKFIRMDLMDMPFENCFGCVTCMDVLEHFKDLVPPLNAIKKVMKDKAYFIITAPIESLMYKLGRMMIKGIRGEPCAGVHYHNAKQIDNTIKNNGFIMRYKKKVRLFGIRLFDVILYMKTK